MKVCSQCKLSVVGDGNQCPLCQSHLIDDSEKANVNGVFPKIPFNMKQYYLLMRILLFISIIIIVGCGVINAIIPVSNWWYFILIGVILSLWAAGYVAMSKRKNVYKNVLYEMFVVSIICIAWDYFTGYRGWAIDYVIPILFIVAMLLLVIVSKILKISKDDYLIYVILSCLFSIIPIIFILTNIVNQKLPSILCIACSIIFLSAILIFQGDQVVSDLKRRLHW